jgi:ABC-type transport system involved in cytochrome bd biosynthesis fused ATPase/permease subunit
VGRIAAHYTVPSRADLSTDDYFVEQSSCSNVRLWSKICGDKKIELVWQEPVFFQTTIRENILYGKHEATDAEMFEALEIASGRKFIEK